MTLTERPVVPRSSFHVPLCFRPIGLIHDRKDHAAESINLSRRGLFFASDVDLRVGMPIELALRLPRELTGYETVDARCFGPVVHARTGMFADGRSGYGVEIEKFTSPAYAENWAS